MTSVLISPITITPTKALTPSHIKGLLWVDVMYRATALATEVTYRYSNTAFNTTNQTLGFWEYLDRTVGDMDYSACGEERIGELYVRYHSEQDDDARFDALRPYLRAVEGGGWVHPASASLIELWREYFARLGIYDPGLAEVQHPPMSQEEVLEFIVERGLCLDNRASGGPVYLDGTRWGLPLRKIVSAENQPNYLVGALRELIPLARNYDEIVLIHDRELIDDYVLLQAILFAAGGNAVREVIDRVPIDGEIKSSREGGWEDCTLPAMLAACEDAEPEALRLGMRLYFIAILGRGSTQSFKMDLLQRTVRRASKLLEADSSRLTDEDLAAYVGQHRGDRKHIDPYRLTSALLNKNRNPPVRDLAERVFC